uniref:helix-turn-helix domain-containing protein n=2 Tax=Pseudomonas sp. AU10 TaxID=882697 RepID=UPI0021E2A2F3|nr:helix-turn-helix transcriptional regulator [Pseudomonas sp. AU10]MCV2231149.1 helix-turn-helix domain-containing protein [Pseudomonas sp. AU10]
MHQNSLDEFQMSIGDNIRIQRERARLSQKTVAEALGSGENTVAGWEKGRSIPPGDKVAAMAKLFKCSTDELLLEESDRNVSEDMKALFRRYNELDEHIKPMARNIINGMLGSLEMTNSWDMVETVLNRRPMQSITREEFTAPPPKDHGKTR